MIVLASLALLPSIVLADITVPPGTYPHADAIRTVAETYAVALVASARCPDVFASTEIDKLQERLGLDGRDTRKIVALETKLTEGMNVVAERIGAQAWCDEAYSRFGPTGSMMKGLLKRCVAGSAGC